MSEHLERIYPGSGNLDTSSEYNGETLVKWPLELVDGTVTREAQFFKRSYSNNEKRDILVIRDYPDGDHPRGRERLATIEEAAELILVASEQKVDEDLAGRIESYAFDRINMVFEGLGVTAVYHSNQPGQITG